MSVGTYIRTKEIRQRISETSKERIPWNKGLTKKTDIRIAEYSKKLKGKHLSKETKQKISKTKKGCIPWNKGRQSTEETKRKIGIAHKGNKYPEELYPNHGMRNKHHTEKTKKKISIANKGREVPPLSKEWRQHISESHVGMRDKHHSKETKRKMSLAAIGRIVSKKTKEKLRKINSGENHPNWRGGIFVQLYPVEFNKELRELIKCRDNYKCQLCGRNKSENDNRELTVHHIDYNKKNSLPSNLITLCGRCNTKVNYKREYWTKYFIEKRR